MIVVVILPFVREKVTCFTSPDRLPISGAALPVSDSGGSTAPGLFLTWCLCPRPNVGVVFSPDCAGTLAFKHGRRARRTSGTEEFVLNSPAFLPGFTWVFCAGVFSPDDSQATGDELDPAFLPGFTWVFCL